MLINVVGPCSFDGCDEDATHIAAERLQDKWLFRTYCHNHAVSVIDAESAEYVTSCPNCHCIFGVG